jgi:hypothetical protein
MNAVLNQPYQVSEAAFMHAAALAGFNGNDNPHLYSSPAWYAHALGRYLHDTGRCVPRNVRMGRGYSIRANDMRFAIKETGAGRVTFERIE